MVRMNCTSVFTVVGYLALPHRAVHINEVSYCLCKTQCTQSGRSALIHAAIKGHLEVVQVLVQAKVDVNLQDTVS